MRNRQPNSKSRRAIWLALAAVLVLGAGLVSCGGASKTGEETESSAPNPISGNPIGKPVDPSTAGAISGKVTLDGAPPERKPVAMATAPACARQYSSPPLAEDVIAAPSGELQNVVVYLRGEFSAYAFPLPAVAARMDQKGCMFVPHVVAVRAGAPLQFLNSDDTSHNIHPVPSRNREWNESQPRRAAPLDRTFAREEVAIPIKCNLHHWMSGYIAVLGNPFFQVTGADGSFDIEGIPPGAYTLVAWQEHYGATEQPITVEASQKQSVAIVFHATPR